ncbi:hypothetical protein GN316_04935 [Xylophilus sp. Kf1]|nr:hypothetical protein [Xylophilus sp. Kf1]
MTDAPYAHLLSKTLEALRGKHCWDQQCELDKVATAIVLNRPDWLGEIDYTLVEAAARIGPEWMALLPRVAHAVMDAASV